MRRSIAGEPDNSRGEVARPSVPGRTSSVKALACKSDDSPASRDEIELVALIRDEEIVCQLKRRERDHHGQRSRAVFVEGVGARIDLGDNRAVIVSRRFIGQAACAVKGQQASYREWSVRIRRRAKGKAVTAEGVSARESGFATLEANCFLGPHGAGESSQVSCREAT